MWTPWNWNFEGFEMETWNIQMGRTQKVDEENGVIRLVIILTPGVIAIKM